MRRATRRPAALLGLTGASSLALCALAAPAAAQDMRSDASALIPPDRTDVSPQYAAFELRFGPYKPKVDENTNQPVYESFFGDGQRFMFGFEVDWQAYRVPYVGTLGIGASWSYTQMSATNIIPDMAVGDQADVSQASSLNIMPIYAVAVLRIDTFAKNLRVPLVPYVKLGPSFAFWWVNDGLGTATSDSGTKGEDTSFGIQAAVGGMFLLDILEPTAARAADSDGGVNNSYIFFEWSMSNYGGDQMNVGSNNWVTGLAFEM